MSENEATTQTTDTGAAPPPAGVSAAGDGTLLAGGTQQTQENQTLLGDSAKQEGDGQTGEAAKPPTAGAPENYEFKAPEGLELDSGMVEQFTPIAKELNLTNDQAQKLVDLYAGQVQNLAKANVERWETLVSGWAESSKNDPEFGGKNLEISLGHARKALKTLGDDGLNQILAPPSAQNPNGMGLGNHPAVIRLLARIGKGMGEDNTHIQNNQAPTQIDIARKMFPDMK